MKKIYYSFILLFLFLCPLCVDARREISAIKADYKENTVYTEHYYYMAWNCSNNGNCKGVGTNAIECAGFVARVYRDYFGVDSSWGTVVTDVNGIYNLAPGDIVRFDEPSKGANTSVGHSVIIMSRNGGTVTVAEANVGANHAIHWNDTYSIERFRIGFDHITKAWFPYGNPSAAPAIKQTSNVTASYTGNNKRVTVDWDYVTPSSDYRVRIYDKAKADKNDFRNPVYDKSMGTSQIKHTSFEFDKEGEFAIGVTTILDDYSSKEKGYSYFTVKAPTSVTLSGLPTGTIYVGDSFKLTSTIVPDSANINRAITWESSNTDVATVSNGNVSVKGEGSAVITATTANNKKASVTITARKKIEVSSVTLNESSKELWTGNTYQLRATVTPNNADNKDVSWSSSKPSVATVDANGKVTAISRGTTYVYASVGGKSAYCLITVRTTGLALDYTKSVDVVTSSNYYLRSNLKTNDGSAIDWEKVTFRVEGKEGTYKVSGNYIDFLSNFYGESYTVYATYYGVTSSIVVKPVQTYSANAFELLNTEGEELTLFNGYKKDVDFYFKQKANYYPITHLYLNTLDLDINYDKNLVGIFNLSSEYDFVNIYDDGKGTIHVSFDMGEDVFVVDEKNLFHITFIGRTNDSKETDITYSNFKYRVATKNYSLNTGELTNKLHIKTKPYIKITSIGVDGYQSKMEVGKTYQLTPVIYPSNATEEYTYTFKSSNTKVATVDNNGKVTPVGTGSCNITLNLGKFSKTLPITVEDNTIYITDLEITSDLSRIYKGTTYVIYTKLYPENQTETNEVEMTSSDSNILSISSSYGNNYWIAKNEGTVTVTCKAGKFTKKFVVTVKPTYVSVTGISVSVNKTTLTMGTTAKASGVITPSNATEKSITWSSSNKNICTVDSNGVITGVKSGTCTITGRSYNGKTDTKTITVVSDIKSISFDKTSLKLIKGDTAPTLKLITNPTNAVDKNITWSSTDYNVIRVDSTGKLSIYGVGNATVTAKTDNNLTAKCEISVVSSTLSLSPSVLNLTVGDTSNITATVTPDYANKSIAWSSSDENVCKVVNGKVSAISTGNCTIYATNAYKVKKSVYVTVKAKQVIKVTSITLDKSNLSISVDDKVKLNATINPSNATNKNITWSSSNTSVAKVVNGEVTGVAPGYATITAKVDGKSTTCGVSVVAKRVDVTSIDLDITSTILKVGENKTIRATVNPSNASNKKITWSSSNSNIVSVNNGVITAKKIGKAVITAAIGNITKTCEVEVINNDNASVYYHTHVQDVGDQDYVSNGMVSGTSHQSKRLEAIRIYLANTGYSGSIEYRTHVQDYGWMDYVRDGEMSGTSHQSKRLEAIQIRLTGEVSEHYDIYYRVHAQEFGWMSWACNDAQAGTAGFGYRLEAIEIMLLPKGTLPPVTGREVNVSKSFVKKMVIYNTHVESYGWRREVFDGAMSGTSHESKRLEAISIRLYKPEFSGDIEYQTHIQDYGWESNWKRNNETSGTIGKSKRLEAIRIRLTGEMSEHYDVYYRVHAQNFGWMGWAKNGEDAGTAHYSYRLEAIEIVVVPKGENPPSRSDIRTQASFVDKNA